MRPRKPIKHGTESGYTTHRSRGEEPCERCRAGHRRYFRDRKRIERASAAEAQLDAQEPLGLDLTAGKWVIRRGGVKYWEAVS